MKKLIPFLILISLTLSNSERIRCPVQWVDYSAGDPFPEAVLKSSFNETFGQNEDGIAGIVDPNSLKLLTPISEEEYDEYLIAVNSPGCNTTWVYESDSIVTVGPYTLGRVETFNESLSIFGIIIGGTIYYLLDGEFQPSRNYNQLSSYQNGFLLEMYNFEFENTPETSVSLIGYDEMFNEADTTITQSVTHSSAVEDSLTLVECGSESYSFAGRVKGDVKFGGLASAGTKFESEKTEEESWQEEYSKTMSRTISVTREVTVGPRMSVNFCTFLGKMENFVSSYTSKIRYSAAGWTGEEIKDYLVKKDDQFQDLVVDGKTAEMSVTGEIKAALSMNTKFVVVPQNSIGDCTE